MAGHRCEHRIRRVLQYIHDNPSGDLSLDRLAEVAAMSRFHWHRVFHSATGETCAQAVRRIRLHRASCWLVQTDRDVGRIARDAGYGSVQSFTRAFGQVYGLAPAAFRKDGRLSPPFSIQIEGETGMFDVEIRDLPERRLYAMAHKGAYTGIGRAFQTLDAMASARGLWPQVEAVIGVYYCDPSAVAEADLRSHAGLAVAPDLPPLEGAEDVHLAGGRYAVLTFRGPYSGLKAGYDYLYGPWLQDAGEEPRDAPSYEIYVNSPMDTAPADLVTEICMPLSAS